MSKIDITIVGCDKDAIDELQRDNKVSIKGYCSNRKREEVDLPFLGNVKTENDLSQHDKILVLSDDINLREFCIKYFGRQLSTYISPNAIVSQDAKIEAGSLVLARAFISKYAAIGMCTKINVGSQIHHDAVVGKACVIAPSCTILGNCEIANYVYMGAGSILREKCKLGERSIIGMGSVIVKDILAGKTAFGNPCKEMTNNE